MCWNRERLCERVSVPASGAAGRPFPPCPPRWALRPIAPPLPTEMAYPPLPTLVAAVLARTRSQGAERSFASKLLRVSAFFQRTQGLAATSQFHAAHARRSTKQASTTPTTSERDGDANPVGGRRRAGRSGQAGGHGGIRIPVALAQHRQLSKRVNAPTPTSGPRSGYSLKSEVTAFRYRLGR